MTNEQDSNDLLGEIKIPEVNPLEKDPRAEEILNDLPGVFDAAGIPGLSPSPASTEEFASASEMAPEPDFGDTPSTGEAPIMGDAPALGDSPLEFNSGVIAEQPTQPENSEPSIFTPSKPDALGEIRRFSENEALPRPSVAAALPFSLLIEGELDAYEKDKLLDLLARENMGIRDMDLEPQFEARRILIPRISEYAAVLLVQALRGTSARIRLRPSDEELQEQEPSFAETKAYTSTERTHPAESIPITPGTTLPGLKNYVLVDTITVSASLISQMVEAERSHEYQKLLESLQRELRYKAHHKGATAILNFQVHLTSLSLPSRYRLMLMGSAIRPEDLTQETSSEALGSSGFFTNA